MYLNKFNKLSILLYSVTAYNFHRDFVDSFDIIIPVMQFTLLSFRNHFAFKYFSHTILFSELSKSYC